MELTLTITKKINGHEVTFLLDGSINTATAPKLENELMASINDISKLILDFSNVQILTSAGIRVLLTANATMKKQGEMVIINCNSQIKNIFEITSLDNIFNIK